MRRAPLLALVFAACLGASGADPVAGARGTTTAFAPALAAASSFGQGWDEATFHQALDLPVRDFRDTLRWTAVEREPETYRFDRGVTAYPLRIASAGGRMSLTINWGNPLHDGGDTPYTPEGRAALGSFVAAALDANPAIRAVEVGNEFNGDNFVSGPVLEDGREARAAHHLGLLRAVHDAVKRHDPEIAVIGGAAHSIPLGYIWPLLEMGAAEHMDALALHPYSTPPEQLARQIAVLRRAPGASELPIQVTEFGWKDPGTAPGYLMRMMCAMALSGVERAAWYPLSTQGDERVPLIDPATGGATSAGRAFAFARERLARRPAEDASPDPFTYACKSGVRRMLIWGEPRDVTVDAGVRAFSPEGELLDPAALRLSPERPILLEADKPLALGGIVRLGPTSLVADSYHQFAYPEEGDGYPAADPFHRFARRGDREIPLGTMPGQEAAGTPWTPYLGNRFLRPARLTASSLVPGGGRNDPVEIVHRWTADRSRAIAVSARWAPGSRSRDGIEVAVLHDGVTLYEAEGPGPHVVALPRVEVARGDRLEFVVGPGDDAKGDVTDYRITLRDAG